MKTTYQISKGQQYDPEGAYVEHGILWVSYTAAGQYDAGHPVRADHAETVLAAVRRVIETGQDETIVVGADTPSTDVQSSMPVCDKCGTVCYGDCRS